MSVKNVKKISWSQVVWVLATRCNDYRFLLSLICDYRKAHRKVKSLNRIAYYVLKTNYSTTLMLMLAFCAENIDEFMKWKEEYALLSSNVSC